MESVERPGSPAAIAPSEDIDGRDESPADGSPICASDEADGMDGIDDADWLQVIAEGRSHGERRDHDAEQVVE